MNVAPPPAMPIAFHPISEELKPTSWKPTPPVVEAPMPKPRKYVLRDGDSLERLAERLLGDRTRAEEIFAMNRHVLSREDLLPVGKEIVLPLRRPE
jgi:nucleoid-associated protein YgaU